MKKFLLIIVWIYFIGAFLKPVQAQWIQTNGPEGGPVRSIVSDGSYLYVTTFGAIFRSSDNGATWEQTGMNNAYALGVINSTLLAGTHGGGVYRSTDHGETWTRWNSGLPGGSHIYDFAVKGINLFAATGYGVYLSTDNGANWTPLKTGMTSTFVLSLIFKDEFLFAGTWGGGVFRSADDGLTWTEVNEGLTSDIVVWCFTVIDTILFAGTWWGDGVYRSLDDGITWTAENYGVFNPDVNDLIVYDNNLFAATHGGVFCSTDQAQYWFQSNTGLRGVVNCFHINGSDLFAGADGGIYVSDQSGDNWTVKNSGLRNTIVNDMVISGSNLIAGTSGSGLFLSNDEGSSWTRTSIGSNIFSFTVSDSLIVAGSNGQVFTSEDCGEIWNRHSLKLTFAPVNCVAMIETYIFTGTEGDGVFLSTDDGESWGPINTGLTDTVVYSFVVKGTNLYAATPNGVFFTADNGNGWIPIHTGLTGMPVKMLTICDNWIFAGTKSGGIFRLNSDGATWTAVNNGLDDGAEVNCLTISDTDLFVVTNSGIFLSENLGESWLAVDLGSTTTSIISLQANEKNLFAGTSGSSIWRHPLSEINVSVTVTSPDGGENWKAGETKLVTWTSNNIQNVKLEYSANAGGDWSTIVNTIAAYPSSYSWTIPDTVSNSCLVRISDVTNASINDVSNNLFTIFQPSLLLTSPNGCECWKGCSVDTITWIANHVQNIKIEYSADGGINWSPVVNTISAEPSFYPWIIPDTTSTSCLVKLSDVLDTNIYDISDSCFSIESLPVAILSADNALPLKHNLLQNFPNPFNPATHIKFALPVPEFVKIEVYSLSGQKIITLLNKLMPAGYHEVEFNGQNVSSGLYLYRMEAGKYQIVKKMILIK